MRRRAAMLLALVLGFAMSSGAVAANPPEAESVRIVIHESDARAEGLSARHRFGQRVSADATAAQLQSLAKRGVRYELVPTLELSPDPGAPAEATAAGKKGSKNSKRPIPPVPIPWGVKAVYGDPNLTAAELGSGGAGVVVAVLDTGSTPHSDFVRADGSPVIVQCVDFTDKKVAVVDGYCKDGHGHGTHVTGIVAAAGGADGQGIFGVAPGAAVYSYKVLTDKGGGYADDIAMGIRTAADRGAQIISMSFGLGTLSPLIEEAVEYAAARGVLLVAAVGNAGPTPDTIGYPSALPQVVAVAGLNPDESVMAVSSRGVTDGDDSSITHREVEVSAPGYGVISTSRKGGYEYRSGTSMAAPHVAGLAAVAWRGSASRTRDWLVSQALQHDITTAESAADALPGYDTASGYGMPQEQPSEPLLWTD